MKTNSPINRDRCGVDKLKSEIELLREALRKAILSHGRVVSVCIDYDPAGSTYETDWAPEVKEWAKLAKLDLSKHDPSFFML